MGPRLATVADVLTLEGITLAVDPQMSALERPVRWVHTTELADPARYLRQDELVCTVGAGQLTPEAWAGFVATAAGGGASAICFGAGDVHDEAPPALLAACREHALPLLVAPFGLPFLLISDLVTERRVAAEQSGAPAGLAAALERDRVGRLLVLVADRLASPQAVRPLVETIGLDPDTLVVTAWASGPAASLERHLEGWLVGESPAGTLAVGPGDADIRSAAASVGHVCGVSEVTSLASLGRAVTTARAALAVARRHARVVGPDELASLDILLEHQPAARLHPFVEHVLDPLRRADPEGSLASTLSTFIAENRSVERTARELFVHGNTVRQRLARVARLTGKDPYDFEDLVTFRIALWAADRNP